MAALNSADNIDTTPAGSVSAATWRGFDSSLYKIALDATKAWDCNSVDASVPINKLAVRPGLRLGRRGSGAARAHVCCQHPLLGVASSKYLACKQMPFCTKRSSKTEGAGNQHVLWLPHLDHAHGARRAGRLHRARQLGPAG